MKLVLAAGMNPRVAKQGPSVLLAAGWWKLSVENHKDSELVLHILPFGRVLPMQVGESFNMYDGESVKVTTLNGTEDYLNIFVEPTNGPVLTATAG